MRHRWPTQHTSFSTNSFMLDWEMPFGTRWKKWRYKRHVVLKNGKRKPKLELLPNFEGWNMYIPKTSKDWVSLKTKIKELCIGSLIANTYILAFDNVYIHPYYFCELYNTQYSSVKIFDKYAKRMPLATPKRIFFPYIDSCDIIPNSNINLFFG